MPTRNASSHPKNDSNICQSGQIFSRSRFSEGCIAERTNRVAQIIEELRQSSQQNYTMMNIKSGINQSTNSVNMISVEDVQISEK